MLAPNRNPVFRMHMRACQPAIPSSGQSQPFEAAPSDTLADLRATRTAENVIAPRAEAVGELANP